MIVNGFHIQWTRLYGVLLGLVYYDPNIEYDLGNIEQKVDPLEYYQEVTFCFLFFGVKVTWW